VDALRIPLSAITDEGIVVEVTAPGERLWPKGVKEMPLTAVRIAGDLVKLGDKDYLFRGRIVGAYRGRCDRCLADLESPFDLETVWSFKQGVAKDFVADLSDDADTDPFEESPSVFIFEGNDIDLTPSVCEEIVLAAPAKTLCREDCAGLCARCGANLNIASCSCGIENETGNSALAGLADLFPNLRPDVSKE